MNESLWSIAETANEQLVDWLIALPDSFTYSSRHSTRCVYFTHVDGLSVEVFKPLNRKTLNVELNTSEFADYITDGTDQEIRAGTRLMCRQTSKDLVKCVLRVEELGRPQWRELMSIKNAEDQRSAEMQKGFHELEKMLGAKRLEETRRYSSEPQSLLRVEGDDLFLNLEPSPTGRSIRLVGHSGMNRIPIDLFLQLAPHIRAYMESKK